MSSLIKKKLRKLSNIWLIGPSKDCLQASVPTNHELLLRFFFEHQNNKNNILKSILIIYQELSNIFEFLRLPIAHKSNFVKGMKILVNKYTLLKKNKNKITRNQREKEAAFLKELNSEYLTTSKSTENRETFPSSESEEDSGIFFKFHKTYNIYEIFYINN